MASEFDRLMQLAERNTADMEQMSLQRKRLTGAIAGTDNSKEREEREKQRKRVLEERIKQREEEERRRQESIRAAQERRRREKVEAGRAGDSTRKQSTTSRNTGISVVNRASTKTLTAKPPARATSASRDSVLEASPKRPKTQALSYDQLMSIASGNSAAPTKTTSRPQAVPTPRASIIRRQTDRSRSPNRTTRPRSPSDDKRKLPTIARDAVSAQSKRPAIKHATQPERAYARSSTIDGRRDAVSRKPISLPTMSRERNRQKEITSPTRTPAASASASASAKPKSKPAAPAPAPASRQQPPPVRKVPEREIDRFGVCPGGKNASMSARKEPPGRKDPLSSAQRRRSPPTAVSRDSRIRDSRDSRNRNAAISRLPRDSNPQPNSRSSRYSTSGRHDALRRGTDDRARGGDMSRSSRPINRSADRRRQNGRAYGDDGDDDDESDYDSMDDFVVDDEEEEGGSRYRAGSIREMFGVRYHDVDDDDDDDMEVSATQLMREDRISAKMGKLEDEEEERRLEEEERNRRRRMRERERR